MMQAVPDYSSQILQQFEGIWPLWSGRIGGISHALLMAFVGLELATAFVLVIFKHDLVSSLVHEGLSKLIALGVALTIALNGDMIVRAIIETFQLVGQTGAGVPGLSPGDIIFRGANIAGSIFGGSSATGMLLRPGAAFTASFCGVVIMFSFVVIAGNFLITMVETYFVLAIGSFFLAFTPFRPMRPYAERYFGWAMAAGTKMMTHYFLIGVAMTISQQWVDQAFSIPVSGQPAMSLFVVFGAACIFAMMSWQLPKIFASAISGTPNFSHGDAVGMVTGAITTAIGAAVISSKVGAAAAAVGGSISGASGGSSKSMSASAGAGSGSSTVPTKVSPKKS